MNTVFLDITQHKSSVSGIQNLPARFFPARTILLIIPISMTDMVLKTDLFPWIVLSLTGVLLLRECRMLALDKKFCYI